MGRKNSPYKPIYKQPRTKEEKLKIFAAVMFWVVFGVFITCLFILNWPKIRVTMQNALWPAWFKSRTPPADVQPAPAPQPEDHAFSYPVESAPAEITAAPRENPGTSSQTALPSREIPFPAEPSAQSFQPPAGGSGGDTGAYIGIGVSGESSGAGSARAPAESAPAGSATAPGSSAPGTAGSGGANSGASAPAAGAFAEKPPQTAPQMRDRALYFIQVDRSGAIIRTKTTRTIPGSDSPLLDVMQALLTGPTDAEKRQGFISLIPEGTQVIAARVLKDTAYIDLSESFQYNTYGVEGYAGQLDQVIWTATEFANVKNVQILVDGRRLDYLGEGIWIGTPLGRDRF